MKGFGSLGIEVYSEEGNNDPIGIAKKSLNYAKEKKNNIIIIDTAGRLAVDEKLMVEISNINESVNPSEILFVVDSMTGQDAVNTAKAFHDVLNFDGVVLNHLLTLIICFQFLLQQLWVELVILLVHF